MRQPSIQILDLRRPDEILVREAFPELSVGNMLPKYDPDSQLLYLGQKGGSSLYTFDCSVAMQQRPVKVDTCPVKGSIQGLAMLPKQACNVMGCEVARLYKLSGTHVSTISATVERKVVQFHEDLFPPTFSNKAVLTSAQFVAGTNAVPFLLSPDPAKALFPRADNIDYAQECKEQAVVQAAAAKAAQAAAEREAVDGKSSKRASLDEALRQAKLRNITGYEPLLKSTSEYVFDLQPGPAVGLSRALAVNSQFWATPWKTLGGSALLVHPIGKTGRLSATPALIRGHAQPLTCFSLSNVQPNLVATGSMDALVKIWQVPGGGLVSDITDDQALANLRGSDGRITTVGFHPFAANVVASSDFGFDVGTMRVWDLTEEKERFKVGGHTDVVMDLQFSPNGGQAASTCKDGMVRLIDPRAQSIVSMWAAAECYRDCSVSWLSDTQLVTVGCAKQSQRSISLWDLRRLPAAAAAAAAEPAPAATLPLDPSNICPQVICDRDSKLLYVAHTGEKTMQIVQLNDEDVAAPFLQVLTTFQSQDLIGSLAALPQTRRDVRNVTLLSGFMLGKRDIVMPLNFRLPRKRTEFFQDDVYPMTDAEVDESFLSAADWFGGSALRPERVSMQPAGMTPLSQAPPEELTHRQVRLCVCTHGCVCCVRAQFCIHVCMHVSIRV
jgi:coronin-7